MVFKYFITYMCSYSSSWAPQIVGISVRADVPGAGINLPSGIADIGD